MYGYATTTTTHKISSSQPYVKHWRFTNSVYISKLTLSNQSPVKRVFLIPNKSRPKERDRLIKGIFSVCNSTGQKERFPKPNFVKISLKNTDLHFIWFIFHSYDMEFVGPYFHPGVIRMFYLKNIVYFR
jgi:hypothetical protein